MAVQQEEIVYFIKEIGRLIEDYRNCTHDEVKYMIYKEIQLLSDVIVEIDKKKMVH
ncbi:hypothetical protein [Metabacillus lacus]|uniref:hypothetical protein n=1 Tax=Metabacillus lacus TaxID=1983721 RepID=UPI0012AFDF5E|nr:hypothetical protein [Metabacillus lacus]